MPEFLFSLSNLSIKHPPPLLMRGLLLGSIAASPRAGYRVGKESPLEVGHELQAERLLSLSQHCAVDLTNQTLPVPNDQAIKIRPRFPSAAIRSGLTAILQQCAAPPDPNNLQLDVWDAVDSLNLAWPNGLLPQPAERRFEFDEFAAEPFKIAKAIRKERDPGSMLLLESAHARSKSDAKQTGPSSLWQGTIVRIS